MFFLAIDGHLKYIIPAPAGIHNLVIFMDPDLDSGFLLHSTSSIHGVVRRGDEKQIIQDLLIMFIPNSCQPCQFLLPWPVIKQNDYALPEHETCY